MGSAIKMQSSIVTNGYFPQKIPAIVFHTLNKTVVNSRNNTEAASRFHVTNN